MLVFTLHNEKRGPATISKPTFDHNRVTFEYHDRNALDTFVRRSANPASASAKTFLSVRSGELHAAGGCTDDDSSLDGDDVGNDHPLASGDSARPLAKLGARSCHGVGTARRCCGKL